MTIYTVKGSCSPMIIHQFPVHGVVGVHPAVIAAIASRASGAGLQLSNSGYNKNGNNHYGIMQVGSNLLLKGVVSHK